MNTGSKAWLRMYIILSIFTVSNYVHADNSFNSIGGYTLGQSCTNPQFSIADSSVKNPNDLLDEIKIKRNQINMKLKGGYDLKVECGLIDNKVNYLLLSSEEPDDISDITESLKEKMGRPADDSNEINSKPQNLLGVKIDGLAIESEKWFLSDSITAFAHTMITIPYGSYKMSDYKWSGGIEVSINDRELAEWNYLKQKGSISSKQSEALSGKKRKELIRDLLN